MTNTVTIVTTVSNYIEYRGPLSRLHMLINYFKSQNAEVEICCVSFSRPNVDVYLDCTVYWVPVAVKDFIYILMELLQLRPISVALFQRRAFRAKKGSLVCFHLVRAMQLSAMKSGNNDYFLDYCEHLSRNFQKRSSFYGRLKLKKYVLLLESKLLKNFEQKLPRFNIKKIYVISASEQYGPASFSEVIVPDSKERLPTHRIPISTVSNLLFLGHVDYEPNLDSIIRLLKYLKYFEKTAHVHIVGKVSGYNRSLLERYPNAIVYGYLEDPKNVARRCDLGFAYITIGTGTQNKVFDYLTYNLPVIVSESVGDGLSSDVRNLVHQCGDLEKFIESEVK